MLEHKFKVFARKFGLFQQLCLHCDGVYGAEVDGKLEKHVELSKICIACYNERPSLSTQRAQSM